MDSVAVLDCDWFIIEGEKIIKKFAWCVVESGDCRSVTFDLPSFAYNYERDLVRQASFSHHIPWNEKGEFSAGDNGLQLLETVNLQQAVFYAKGLDKCRFLEKFLGRTVTNLEEFDCPTYENLTTIPRSTLNKAVIFGLWLRNMRSRTSWVLRDSMFLS